MKNLKYWQLCLAIWLGIASLSCAQNKATIELAEDEKLIEFTTDRFTLPNLHVTPDEEYIIFDVLGDIYKVPIEGGKAEVILQDNNWKRAGKLSPDGKTLAYVSDETGWFQVWTLNLETLEKRVYPIIESMHYPLYAYWRDNNSLLVPSNDGLQSFNIVTGEGRVTRVAFEEERSIMNAINRKMSVLKSGGYAFFEKDSNLLMFDVNNMKEEIVSEIPYKTYLDHLRVALDRRSVVFYKINNGYFSTQDLIYWDLNTGETNKLYSTDILGGSTNLNYSFDFIDDTNIVLDKEGEIVRMNIETGEYEPIPIEVEVKKTIKKPLRREPQYIKDSTIIASILRNPVTRKDLDTIYFGVFGKLHSYAKRSGLISEIYPEHDRFEISPSLSPDGKYLAYTTWHDMKMGHVYAREVHSGKEYQITNTPGRYINPAWSLDGSEIVFVADETEAKRGIHRLSGGPNTHNYHLNIHRIMFSGNNVREKSKSDTIYKLYPFSILPRRFYPIPVYHPDGESIFITTWNREKNLPNLIEIDFETKEVKQERLIPFHTDEVVISPNAESIAFIYDEQVWIDSFPYTLKLEFNENSEFISKKNHYRGGYVSNILIPEAKSIYEVAPSYLAWQDDHTLMWGSAEELYTYDVRTGMTEKIADIKVQKPRAIPKTQYALTNARIITMNKQDDIIEKGTILVKDNRIEEVGKVEEIVIPENYKVFNLKGKTIMPGLIDVHAHYHVLFPFEILAQENYAYKGNLAYGVTTIYDPSVNVLDYREQAQMVETGQLLGPRVFASGNIIMDGTRQYDYKNNLSQNDSDRILESYSKLGVSGPIKEYDYRNREKRKKIKVATEKYNRTITAHQNSYIESMCRVIDGYTAIEHEIGGFKLNSDAIKLVAKSGVNYTPTFIVTPLISELYVDKIKREREKLTSLNGKLLYHQYITLRYKEIDSISLLKNIIDIKRASFILKDMVDYGGVVSVGGHGNPLPGIGTHWELWAFTFDEGLSNYQALRASTINGAEKLDFQEELGSVEKGKLADLMILNTNPLDNIFNTADILYTVKNGVIFTSEDMREIYIEN